MVSRIAAAVLAVGVSTSQATQPLVIAHRGASGHRPEHTIEAYRLAVEMGADFIEPDLVSTRDGVLVARHENEIGETTDVADRFPARKRTANVDGETITGWFIEDFTLAEVKTLRARERLASRSHAFDGQFEVPTFDEVTALAQRLGRERGRDVGIYPETKHSSYFRQLGLPLEEPLLASLAKHNWNQRSSPVFIQSFETDNLKALRARTTVRLIQLVRAPEQVQGAALDAIAAYADGIGPEKKLVQPVNDDGSLGAPTDLVARAHARKLLVHIWTLRSDREFLPAAYAGDPVKEYLRFRELGVDGLFTDFPDVGVRAFGGPTR